MSKQKSRLHTDPWSYCEGDQRVVDNFNRIFRMYKMMALNRYRWDNLPNGMKSEYIEEALFNRGQALFFEDFNLGLLCLPCAPANKLNVYGEPEAYMVTGKSAYSKYIKADQGVRIKDNDLCVPVMEHILYFATRMAQLQDVYERNLKQQRKPYIATCTKSNELSVKNIVNDVVEGEEVVIVDAALSEDGSLGVQILQTKADYLLDKLHDEMKALEKELLTFLGLDNITDKRERMVVDEVHSNDTSVDAHLDLFYKNRQKACEEINKKFNLNITVVKVVDELNREEAELQAQLFKELGFDQFDNIKQDNVSRETSKGGSTNESE